MMRVMPLLTTCLAVLPTLATASQEARSYEPGVIVRLYDIGVGVHYIPELAPGQLPNVVKVLPTVELTAEEFAPLVDRFMTEVIADLKIEKPGAYRFRLISDDGSRLWIDDELVIDHDGLHGPDPKDGQIELPASVYTLRILHFESAGGEHLELRWRQPGVADDKFTLIPTAALTHDTSVSRETSAGTKKIIPPLRRGRPGDGTPLRGIHPGYRLRRGGAASEKGWRWHGVLAPPVAAVDADLPNSTPIAWLPPAPSGMVPTARTEFGCQWLVGDERMGTLFRIVIDTGDDSRSQSCVLRFSRGDVKGLGSIACADDRSIVLPVVDRSMALADVERVAQDKQALQALWDQTAWLESTGVVAFEMHAVRAMANGFEIEFTKPLDSRCGWEADSYYIEQWPFSLGGTAVSAGEQQEDTARRAVAHAEAHPPRRDGVRYPVKSASVSPGRKKVFLEIENLKESHVVYIRLLPPCVSEDGDLPWSTEAWYTLNAIPKERYGKVLAPPAREPQNFLTAEEEAAGWELLFDGKTTDGWRGYKKDHFPDQGWKVTDDCLVRVGPAGGDICTVQQFDNFELKLEWRICAGGNSGIFYRVDEQYGWPWESGPEMQVLDNAEHADGRNPKTSAGSNYALHAPVRDVTEPVGFFNHVRIVANGPHIEHWLNGVKIVEYELESPEWERLVAESKFKDMPHHGRVKKGHIVLQDHGDKVWYRNIKIRRLGVD